MCDPEGQEDTAERCLRSFPNTVLHSHRGESALLTSGRSNIPYLWVLSPPTPSASAYTVLVIEESAAVRCAILALRT